MCPKQARLTQAVPLNISCLPRALNVHTAGAFERQNPCDVEDDKMCNLRSIGWADLRYYPNVKFTGTNVRMLMKDLLKESTELDHSVHR